MRRAVARADRRHAVRRAAREWSRVGLIDKGARAAFERAFPDDRRRLGPALRSLAFAFTILTIVAAYAFLLLSVRFHDEMDAAGAFALMLGLFLVLLTEILKGPFRIADAGVESASGLAACGFLLGAVVWLTEEAFSLGREWNADIVFFAGMLIFAGAALRWGSTVGAVIATISLGAFLARLPAARLSWVIAALLLAPIAQIGSETRALAPAHRRASAAVLVLALAGLYVALHLGSWDVRFLERGHGYRKVVDAAYLGAPRGFFILTTALVPVAILSYGIAARRRLVLGIGALLGAASLVTLRAYVRFAPLWVILTAVGAALILFVLGLRPWLATGAGGERGGFTAQPLSCEEGKTTHVLATVATVAVATPRTPETAPAGSRFEGGGGRSGGGGATSDY
jgi:hypothetical protein